MKSFVLLDFLGKRLKASSKSSLIGPFFSAKNQLVSIFGENFLENS